MTRMEKIAAIMAWHTASNCPPQMAMQRHLEEMSVGGLDMLYRGMAHIHGQGTPPASPGETPAPEKSQAKIPEPSLEEVRGQLERAQDAALDLVGKLHEVTAAYQVLNEKFRALQGEFYVHQSPIDACVYDQVIKLVDAVLGHDEVGSYFLHECASMEEGGSIRESDGTDWPMKTIDDLRNYIKRNR